MAVDGVLMRSTELLSALQEEIRSLLGLDHTGLVLLSSAALGLLITLVLWVCLRRGSSETHPGKIAPDPGSTVRPRAEESKRRSRRRGGEKKLQRNGLVDLEEELKPAEAQDQDQNQNPNESPDTAGGKSDKAKKNKKKAKAAAKEPKTTSSPSGRKEQEEVGSWETKVSNREKRQQKKDKGPGEDSPGGAEPAANANNNTTDGSNLEPEPPPAVEEPKIAVASTPSTAKPSKTNKASKNANVPTPAAPKKEEPPAADVTTTVIPPVSQVWEDVLSRSVRPDPFVGVSVPAEMPSVPSRPWNSVTLPSERQKPEPSVWPQDMEGSWTIVDSSHIPVSFHGLSAGVEPQFGCDLSWACQPPVDDEWSGLNSASADPVSDWSAPCEEWGNYEELAGVAPHPEEPQESEPEKDKDEAAAPGSGKAKKKKKKKKKVDDAGTAAPFFGGRQVDVEVSVSKVQNSAGITVPKTAKEQDRTAPPRAVPRPAEPEAPPKPAAPPTQKKAEESWESPKQVKKKKARRET
ncbi:protein LYRIC isoform X2 [Trichomycterus rosablanca]|uniref:protein LYRIC isoform X2 n=1 Tax=Trichomycterus rosablanca TaxID=2290929 RepID=UPI002F353DBD